MKNLAFTLVLVFTVVSSLYASTIDKSLLENNRSCVLECDLGLISLCNYCLEDRLTLCKNHSHSSNNFLKNELEYDTKNIDKNESLNLLTCFETREAIGKKIVKNQKGLDYSHGYAHRLIDSLNLNHKISMFQGYKTSPVDFVAINNQAWEYSTLEHFGIQIKF